MNIGKVTTYRHSMDSLGFSLQVDEAEIKGVVTRHWSRRSNALVRTYRLYSFTDGVNKHKEYKKIRNVVLEAASKCFDEKI